MVEEMGMNLTTFFTIYAKKALRERNELTIVHCQLSIHFPRKPILMIMLSSKERKK